MEQLPIYISIIFLLITIAAVYIFYNATGKHKLTLWLLIIWAIIHSVLALNDFFRVTNTIPPRIAFVILPVILTIILLFNSKMGKSYIDKIDMGKLAILHTLRIGVEIILFTLFIYKLMPRQMTFEGNNFDILPGITAIFIYYFGFVKKKLSDRVLLVWNMVSVTILTITITIAVLAVPTVFQQIAFDQPNTAVLYFPFILLPAIVAPLAYFSHVIAIRQLIMRIKRTKLPDVRPIPAELTITP